MKNFLNKALLLLTILSCASCMPGSIYELEPVSFGKDPSQLKISPCACIPVETLSGLPGWLVDFSA